MTISMSELTPHFGELDTIFGDFKIAWEESLEKVEVHLGVPKCDSTTKTAFVVNTSRTWAIQGFTLPCWCPSQCLQPSRLPRTAVKHLLSAWMAYSDFFCRCGLLCLHGGFWCGPDYTTRS